MSREELNDLSYAVIGAAMEVHSALGPGLLEKAYHKALLVELGLRGLQCESEVDVPVKYKDLRIEAAFRADIIVENQIILELKATENFNSLYSKQLLTYLRLSGYPLGLLINFNEIILKEGIIRIIN